MAATDVPHHGAALLPLVVGRSPVSGVGTVGEIALLKVMRGPLDQLRTGRSERDEEEPEKETGHYEDLSYTGALRASMFTGPAIRESSPKPARVRVRMVLCFPRTRSSLWDGPDASSVFLTAGATAFASSGRCQRLRVQRGNS